LNRESITGSITLDRWQPRCSVWICWSLGNPLTTARSFAGLTNATFVTVCTEGSGRYSPERRTGGRGGQTRGPPSGGCETVSAVTHAAASSLTFVVPGATNSAASATRFRVCDSVAPTSDMPQVAQPATALVTPPCSAWVDVNAPDVWWAQGDASTDTVAKVTPGGWLRVYGRAIGFSGGTRRCRSGSVGEASPGVAAETRLIVMTATGPPIALVATAASCYDATFAIPANMRIGQASVTISNALGNSTTDHRRGRLGIEVIGETPWPTQQFVAKPGAIVAAITAASAAGGGVVLLPGGTIDLGSTSLALGDGVALVGVLGQTVLRWSQPTDQALIAAASSQSAANGRYGIHNLTLDVAAATKSFVLDIGGHGVRIDGVTVNMPHSLTSAASVIHTHGTGFSITNSNMTHDQLTCTSPGYPRDCLLFFDAGTDNGLVAHNDFQMGCCAFEGYSASGVILEDNRFTDLPWAVQPDGNGFATFGSNRRVSERISFSRNVYNGTYNGSAADIRDGSYPHEAFTSDGNGGAFTGHPTASTATTVTIAPSADPTYVDAVLVCVSGPGEGQVARVTSAVGHVYSISPPFLVPLSAESVVVVAPYVGAILMQGNVLRNSTTVQIFGSGFDTVYAGNLLKHMFSTSVVHPGGLALMALDYQGGYQPNLHFEIVNNTVSDVTGGIAVMIDGNPMNITLSLGHVIRDNTVVGHRPPPSAFSNIDGGITIGVDATNAVCGCTATSRWNKNATVCW
jgi:hypothetical protein